ncbi:MAG: TraU family protein [Proteobacteria bacterium]|nr:TraU family protein [Pseudomonadota bacterium]
MKFLNILFTVCSILVLSVMPGYSLCGGLPLNPVTEVAWQSIFPVKIGGVRIGMNTDNVETPDMADVPICICPIPIPPFFRTGISVGMWEPTNLIETVKDPFCLPTLGLQLYMPLGLNGTNDEDDGGFSMIQSHYYDFPVWSMMELLVDFACIEHASFDVEFMSELFPNWQDDSIAILLNPEVLLFANPIAQMSCMADAVGSQFGLPIPSLFWCVGSGGSIYPLSGHAIDGDYIQSQFTIASRTVYLQARMLNLMDGAVNICTKIPTPIWIKNHYRFQIAKPVRGIGAIGPGRSSILWGSMKNPPVGGTGTPDNFEWVLFKKRACCAF